jgi:tripartite-type tricarboxylate transporter receptor subunit TctC
MRRRSLLLIVMMGLVSVFFISPVVGAEFPSKQVTYISPWTAGSAGDLVSRALAQTTSKYLGQPVIVENKPGGGGTLGPANMATSAKPDGYTISEIPGGLFRYPHMFQVAYDPLKDFSYIIHLTGYTFAVVVKGDSPFKTFNDLVAYAKANPEKVTYATTGPVSMAYTTMERLARQEGIKWINVPMKGSSEVGPAVLGGHVTAGASPPAFGPLVKSGELRMLVTWGEERAKNWSNVPTLKELGYGFVTNSPYGLAGPKGMDPKIVKILHDAFKKGMDEPDFQKVLDKFDQPLLYKNSKEYTEFAKISWEREKEIIETLGLKKEK